MGIGRRTRRHTTHSRPGVHATDSGMTIDEIKQDAHGAKAILEMFGPNGTPVSKELAERRAMICQFCDENTGYQASEIAPSWWDRAKGAIADTIKRWLEIKHQLGLKVSNEETLDMCKICGCCCRLIVWSPISVLKNHMPAGELEKYPRCCWKKTAIEALGDELK